MNGLLFSDRFDRQGFSEEIVAELTLLVQVHEEQFPEESARRPDPFYRHAVDHCRVDPLLVGKVVRNRALKEPGAVVETAAPPESAAQAPPTRHRREAGLPASESKTQPRWHEIRHIEEFRIYCDLRSKRVLASYPRDARALGDLLVSRGVISREVLAQALRIQRMRSERRKNLGAILMEMKVATADDVMRALCVQSGIPMVNLSSFQVPPVARLALLVLVALVITAPIVAAIWVGRRLGALRRRALRLERASGLEYRDGLDYTPGHVWLRPERGGRLRLGLDDVARQLCPEGVRLGLPAVGSFLKVGEPLAELDWQGVRAALPSPVAGTVIRVNRGAVKRPTRALEEPYTRGWLVQLHPSNGRAKQATRGDEARGWLRGEAARLGHLTSTTALRSKTS